MEISPCYSVWIQSWVYGDDLDLQPFFHHEIFHIYHSQFLEDDSDEIAAAIWQEGLAQCVAKSLNPDAEGVNLFGLPKQMPQRSEATSYTTRSGPISWDLTLAAIHRDANVIAIGALVKAVRAGAAHVARLAAPPAAPRLTLAVDGLVLHRGGGLWSELVAGPWPTCALCDAPVERASITQDVARCATVVAVRCHGETRIVTGPASAGFVVCGVGAPGCATRRARLLRS